MNMNEQFNQKSYNERLFLKKIFPILFPKDKCDLHYYLTAEDGRDIYDGYVMLYDNTSGSIMSRGLIEIKIRETHYPELLLEKKKLDDLTNKANESGAIVIYISVTPQGTYVFNLTSIQKDKTFEWKNEELWISTTDKSKGKKMKKVTYLSCDLARKLDLTTNDLGRLIMENKIVKTPLEKVLTFNKRQRCIFEGILDKK